MGSASKDLQRCRPGVHMHGPSRSWWSWSSVGGPGSPHSDSVFRSNTSTDQTNRDKPPFRMEYGRCSPTLAITGEIPQGTEVPPLGVGDPLPKVSRDTGTCSCTASIWPLRGYARHWDGKRGDNAAFRSVISAWLCHNRLANPLGCLLYDV